VAALEDFNLDEAADGMVADMMPLWSELLEVSGDEAIAALGVEVDVDWSQSNPYVRDVLDRLGTRIRGVADTTRDDVRRLVEQGNERGDSVRQIADFIRERAPEISKSRSQLIARTESSTGANLGAVIAYRAAGIDRVKVLDGDGDPECAAADGQIWTLEEADANPIAHPGCVRAFAPVVEEGQEPQEQAPEAEQPQEDEDQPATTIDEAEARAERLLGVVRVNYSELDVDVAELVTNQLRATVPKDVMSHLEYIGPTDKARRQLGHRVTRRQDNEIMAVIQTGNRVALGYNADRMKSLAEMEKYIGQLRESGTVINVDSPAELVSHEGGHVLDVVGYVRAGGRVSTPFPSDLLIDEWYERFSDPSDRNFAEGRLRGEAGTYILSSTKEFYAEAYRMYVHDKLPKDLEWVKAVFEEGKQE
jgi:hypothetical protein